MNSNEIKQVSKGHFPTLQQTSKLPRLGLAPPHAILQFFEIPRVQQMKSPITCRKKRVSGHYWVSAAGDRARHRTSHWLFVKFI